MNTGRRVVMVLMATGRMTPAEAEPLLAVWDESRETTWILATCLVMICLAQCNVHVLMHFFDAQLPALAGVAHTAFVPIADQLQVLSRE